MKKKFDWQTAMIVIFTVINILIIFANIFCPKAMAADFEAWYVGCDGLNCRNAPEGDVITVYPHGTELSVIGTDGGSWWQVWDGSMQGWVHKDYMVSDPNITYLGVFWSTVYTPDPAENDGYDTDCYGRPLYPQVGELVAVDPNVIPHHRTIYIDGVGYRRTGDSGVYGQHIDILQYGEYDIPTAYRKVWLIE